LLLDERAIILRLGKYQRQVGPGVQARIPFVDNVLVVDIRGKSKLIQGREDAYKGE
jgi:regulator of protease activity HflC (stomatin/prohibitin superfamily)